MGSENEVEQSIERPCRWQVQATARTHLIHRPARDTIPPLGGSRASSCYAIDAVRPLCCRCVLSGPFELGTVNPDSVQDHGQPPCQCDDRFPLPVAPARSRSPDWSLAHVRPNTAPTDLDLRKRAGTSTVAR